MMSFARGFAKYITGGQKISTYVTQGDKVVIKELPAVFKLDRLPHPRRRPVDREL